jgi:hypothetical protein
MHVARRGKLRALAHTWLLVVAPQKPSVQAGARRALQVGRHLLARRGPLRISRHRVQTARQIECVCQPATSNFIITDDAARRWHVWDPELEDYVHFDPRRDTGPITAYYHGDGELVTQPDSC